MTHRRENIIVPTDFIPTNAFDVRQGAMFFKPETVRIKIVDSLTERRTPENQIIPAEKSVKRQFNAGPTGPVNVHEDEPSRMTDYHEVLGLRVRCGIRLFAIAGLLFKTSLL